MTTPAVVNYLSEKKKSGDKAVADNWTKIEEYYNEKYLRTYLHLSIIYSYNIYTICRLF